MEVLTQHVVNVGWVRGDKHVNIGKPRTFDHESTITKCKNVGGKIMDTVDV